MNKINNYHFKKLLNLQIKKYENNTIRYMNNIIAFNDHNSGFSHKNPVMTQKIQANASTAMLSG